LRPGVAGGYDVLFFGIFGGFVMQVPAEGGVVKTCIARQNPGGRLSPLKIESIVSGIRSRLPPNFGSVLPRTLDPFPFFA
jgi:hypothetical protein